MSYVDRYFAKKECGKNFKAFSFRKIHKYIGEGTQGTVYEYGKNQVIKFTNHYDFSSKEFLTLIKKAKEYKAFPKIYSYGSINNLNWLIMEKLPIRATKNDNNFISSLDDSEIAGIVDSVLPIKWKKLARSIIKFNKNYNYIYRDFHYNNIMFDSDDNPKVIDIESYLL